jgi:hypothetical protein
VYSRFVLGIAFLILCVGCFSLPTLTKADLGVGSAEVHIEAVVPGCGNGIVEVGEECDGAALAGATCRTRGFTSGTLLCTASCLYDTTSCVYTPPTSSGGGGGGSNSGNNTAQVVLTGHAYPHSQVTVLKDAQVVATTIADNNASFQVLVKNLAAGTYIFSIYSEDTRGVRSALMTFPVTVTKGILDKIDSIFVAPTITGDKIQVKQGEPIVLFGQSTPISDVTIEVNSDEPHFVKTKTANDGSYLYNFDSTVLDYGQHHAKSRATNDAIISPQSNAYAFAVGDKTIFATGSTSCPKKGDLNNDCRVNLVDFSIAAFWYKKTLSAAFVVREKEHLSGDGQVSIIDFSILAFHWTG